MKDSLLTTKEYWEKYYAKGYANKEKIIYVCKPYEKYWNILLSDIEPEKNLIEIGGYPGRFLAYLSWRYKIHTTCLDYNSDTEQIKGCYNVMGINEYEILKKDFTTYIPQKKYDYVTSNGFVEHFENYDKILDLHMQYLKPNGSMLIMLPNMRGYIKWYKYVNDYNNLKMHNLKIMSLKVFKKFAERNNLKIKHLSYFGTFPYNVHQKHNFFQKVIYKLHRLAFKFFLDKYVERYPSKWFSSSIMCVLEKQEY